MKENIWYMISGLFISKKELENKINVLEKDIENLKHSHKELLIKYNALENKANNLEQLTNGLVENYNALIQEIKNLCGFQEETQEEDKKAKAERTHMSDAIAEVFDWGGE